MDSAALLTRLAEVLDAHDRDALPALLHPDFTCTLVHTGEVFDREGCEQLFAVASFATTHGEVITELTEVWTDVDQHAPAGTRP